MPDPITIPSPFGEGSPLSARLLNGLQEDILRQLYEHTHAGGIEGPQLETEGYADRSVTEPKLADGAVSARTLAAGAVGPGNLAPRAVTQSAIADGAVGTDQLADDAVTEAKLDAAVRLKLNRIGGGVSSASTVIWRDPLVVFRPPPEAPTLVETFFMPKEVYWIPSMIGRTENDEPVRLNPRVNVVNGQEVLDSFDVFAGTKLQDEEPALAKIVDDSIQIATQEIGLVGAFSYAGLGNALALMGNAQPAAGTPAREFVSASVPASGSSPGPETFTRMMALRSATPPPPGQPSASAAMARMAASAQAQTAKVSLTQNGSQAAARMTTVGVVDQNGVPAQPGSDGAFTIAAGFGGREDFLDDGPAVDYRNVGNEADRKRAAKGASETLYNLGLDADYLANSGHKLGDNDLQAFVNLQAGDDQFFTADTSFRAPQSWLLDLLNNPHLFGSGYAISGGRNILSVTRMGRFAKAKTQETAALRRTISEVSRGNEWVRVRFITPYKDSAYAVSVTPREEGQGVIIPQIRSKTPQYCDLVFYGVSPTTGMTRVNKVSFDLAVFGDLTTAE